MERERIHPFEFDNNEARILKCGCWIDLDVARVKSADSAAARADQAIDRVVYSPN
jgi:hypothetical protein